VKGLRFPLVIALALAVGCSKPQPPTIVPVEAVVTRIDTQGVEFRVGLAVSNPNSADLSATGISSRIALNKTQDLGTVRLPQVVTLPAGKTTKIDAPVSVPWSNMGVIAQLAASGGAVPYSVDGTLDLGGALLHVSVPFHIEGNISRDQIVGAAVHSLQAVP
jgi:LEA14-like dessication related protein